MEMTKPTKEEFQSYVDVRDSGMTNMFDIRTVCALSEEPLTREKCFYIMNHFEELAEEYGVEI